MPVPDYETLMLPVLREFARGATSVRECLPAIVAEFGISAAEQQALLPSGTSTVLASRTHWARTYLSKAGLLESPRRGVHKVTKAGRAALDRNPDRIDNAWLKAQSASFGDWYAAARQPSRKDTDVAEEGDSGVSPSERMAQAFAEIEAALIDELLGLIQGMDPIAFERLVLDLLQAMGYGAGSLGAKIATRASGDGGIDGIIHEDALGLDAVYVQAKRYAPDSKVGRPALQQFVGSLTGEGATKGVFVTTSGFSAEARDFLKRVQHRIVLIDGNEFARRMIRHDVGVRTMQVYRIKAVDENLFAET